MGLVGEGCFKITENYGVWENTAIFPCQIKSPIFILTKSIHDDDDHKLLQDETNDLLGDEDMHAEYH